MHHHMQITAVVILLLAHSYIDLSGEDAVWEVLDGKVALGRQRGTKSYSIQLKCCFLDREHLSDDDYQTFALGY